jgi:tripartite-type tricarboxylate transporter receptor subunit TctC
MMQARLMLIASTLATLTVLTAPAALAQGDYPNRPVRLVVAFPPGGATDTFIRPLVDDIAQALGQSVVIENRGGGGGYIAWQQVAGSEPDGYTLLIAENALGVSQALYKKHASNFDPLTQYEAVAGLANSPQVLAAANNLPVQSVKELVAYARSLPGKINYASAGIGSMTHLSTEVVLDRLGIEAIHVPYKGGGPAMADLVAGHVPLNMASLPVGKSLVDAGKIKALAVTGETRSPALPNVPTLQEAGVTPPDMELRFWWGAFAPKGIPRPVAAKLEKAFQTVMSSKAVQQRLAKNDTVADFIPGSAMHAKLQREITNWTRFIDAKGIKAGN